MITAPWILRKGDIVTHTEDGRQGMLDRKLSPMCGEGKWRVQTTRQRTSQDFRTGALTEYTASVDETWQESDMTPEGAERRNWRTWRADPRARYCAEIAEDAIEAMNSGDE